MSTKKITEITASMTLAHNNNSSNAYREILAGEVSRRIMTENERNAGVMSGTQQQIRMVIMMMIEEAVPRSLINGNLVKGLVQGPSVQIEDGGTEEDSLDHEVDQGTVEETAVNSHHRNDHVEHLSDV